MKQQESRDLLLSVFGVAILIIAITGITFAVFSYTFQGKINNFVSTGAIKMNYIESDTNVISIDNALPMSDEIGKRQTDYFDFSVDSQITGLITINYQIEALKMQVSNQLDERYVKIYLEKEENGEYKSVIDPSRFNSTSDSKMLLYSGKFINNGKQMREFISKYRLRMWIDEEYEADEEPKKFELRVNVNAHM